MVGSNGKLNTGDDQVSEAAGRGLVLEMEFEGLLQVVQRLLDRPALASYLHLKATSDVPMLFAVKGSREPHTVILAGQAVVSGREWLWLETRRRSTDPSFTNSGL